MPLTSPELDLSRFLEPGERLVWSGAPLTGLRLRAQDAVMIPFSLVWCGFAIFWTYMVSRTNAPTFFILWGLMFVCIGLFFVFGRFFVDAQRRKNTAYGITDRRVLILSGFFSRELRSLDPAAMPEIAYKLHADGTGTITFGPNAPLPFATRGWPGTTRLTPPAFEFIDRSQEAHRLILALKKPA